MKVSGLFRPEKDCDKIIERLLKENTSQMGLKYAGLDDNPLLGPDGEPVYQTLGEHVEQFNCLDRVMASCGDYYTAGKSGDEKLIKSLRKDFQYYVVCSDRIFYNLNSLDARVVRYFGSEVVEPVEMNIFVPAYPDTRSLNAVLGDEKGLAFIRALFNTTDDKDMIKDVLSALSGKTSIDIIVWSPGQEGRKEYPVRVAFLKSNLSYFLIGGSNYFEYRGRSRGVRLKPITSKHNAENKYGKNS